ncbi:MAG: hypothetical protein ACPL07_01255 [Candidatus Bathyarchaeia archaeon]
MRGFCSKCKEYRSDEGENAWGIVWLDEMPVCEKCGSLVDILDDCEDEIYSSNGEAS